MKNLNALDTVVARITENYALASVVALTRKAKSLQVLTHDDHAANAIVTIAHRQGLSATTFAGQGIGISLVIK